MGNLQTPVSIQKLQSALHAEAKEEPEYRFYLLYDKVYRHVRPRCIRDKMMQPLMRRAYLRGRYARRHRLNALALARQRQPRAVAAKRPYSIGMLAYQTRTEVCNVVQTTVGAERIKCTVQELCNSTSAG